MNDLSGLTALVTGGGQNIGLGISKALAKRGANIIVAQRSKEIANDCAKMISNNYGVKSIAISCDLTKQNDIDMLFKESQLYFEKIDILVNGVGGRLGIDSIKIEDLTLDQINDSMDLNFKTAFLCMKSVFPLMKKQNFGRIINVTSHITEGFHAYSAQYNISKQALVSLTKTAAVEWGKYNITVNAICPAVGNEKIKVLEGTDLHNLILKMIPTGHLSTSEDDVGSIVSWLASKESRSITGTIQYVDGGVHINGLGSDGDKTFHEAIKKTTRVP